MPAARRDRATVGQAIATQGNQALREIIAESTRLPMPTLPPKAAR